MYFAVDSGDVCVSPTVTYTGEYSEVLVVVQPILSNGADGIPSSVLLGGSARFSDKSPSKTGGRVSALRELIASLGLIRLIPVADRSTTASMLTGNDFSSPDRATRSKFPVSPRSVSVRTDSKETAGSTRSSKDPSGAVVARATGMSLTSPPIFMLSMAASFGQAKSTTSPLVGLADASTMWPDATTGPFKT